MSLNDKEKKELEELRQKFRQGEAEAERDAHKAVNAKTASKSDATIGCIALIVAAVVFVLVCGWLFNACTAPTEYKDFNDMTKNEYNDFMKWDKKQAEKARGDEKIGE